MFLVTSEAYTALRTQVHGTASSIASGLLGGEKQGSITRVLPITNHSPHPEGSWQFDPHEFTTAMTRLVQEGWRFQGVYLTNPEALSAPTPEMIRGWRYNVPCFLVSSTTSGGLKISAFAIDPLLQKASPIPVWVDQPPEETVESPEPVPGAVLGRDIKSGKEVLLSYEARRLSLYCIGGMGQGKTTVLLNILKQDIDQGDGLCLIDPHGDFTDDILMRIPPHRAQDVALCEAHDATVSFGLHMFACSDVTDPSLVDQTCSHLMSMFYKLYHTSWGPQMENLLRVTFLTMIYNQDLPSTYRPTFVDVPRLWSDAAYRAYLVARVPHRPVRHFWETIYNPLSARAQLEYRLSSSNKIERFLENRILYNIFGQTQNSIDYRRIMDEAGILLIKLPKGKLGEDNASFLGSIMVGQLLQATLSRGDTPFQKRRPFHICVDEYQNFATKSFATLQTEARKFAIDTIVAHQSRAFLDEESKGATGAVGNIISFAVTGEDAKEMAMMFDNTPPTPPVIGMKPILTICTDPWDHLIRNGHSSAQVGALVMALKPALTPIIKSRLPNYSFSQANPDTLYMWDSAEEVVKKRFTSLSIEDVRTFITEEDVRRFTSLLNNYLYKRMKGIAAIEVAADLHALQERGPFNRTFSYLEGSSYICVPVGATRGEIVAFDAAKSKQLEEEQPRRQAEFYTNLERLAQLLVRDPILTNSGTYEETFDRPRPFADVTNETANTLSTMKSYHALCKLIDAQGNRVQHLIKTYPPLPIMADAYERAECIRQASRARYGRPRDEVEEEIQAREAAWEHILQSTSYREESAKPAKGQKNGAKKQPQQSVRINNDHVATPATPNNTVSIPQPVHAGGNGALPNGDDDFWEPITDGNENV